MEVIESYLNSPSVMKDVSLQKAGMMPLVSRLNSIRTSIEILGKMKKEEENYTSLKSSILEQQKAANSLFSTRAFGPNVELAFAEEAHISEQLFITKIGSHKAFASAGGNFGGGEGRGRRGRGISSGCRPTLCLYMV